MKKRNKNEEENFFILDNSEESSSVTAPHTLTPEEVLGIKDSKKIIAESHSALEALKKRMTASNKKLEKEIKEGNFVFVEDKEVKFSPKSRNVLENSASENVEKNKAQTLQDRCMPYFLDENGKETEINNAPLYELQSVADILKSDSEKIIEQLSESYDILFDDLGINPPIKEAPPEKEEKPIKPEPEIKEKKAEEENSSRFEDIMVISDIDSPSDNIEKPKNDYIYNTSTITFTPITEADKGTKINISTQTRPLDLTGELSDIPSKTVGEESVELKLEKDDFEDYIPDEEIDFEKDSNKFIRKYSLIKRNSFISSFLSILTTAILFVYYLPPLNDLIHSYITVSMLISSVITLIPIISNIDCFKGLRKIFSTKSTADVSASLSVLGVVFYSVFGILGKISITEMHILISAILSFRSLGKFYKSASLLANLKIAASPNPKNTLKLINDSAISLTMADGSVDGDVLVADVQPVRVLNDFMKYSDYGNFINGRLPIITALSLSLSLIIGIASGFYFDGLAYGFYAVSIIQCLTALPVSFLIDTLPVYKATKKLSPKGAMLLGKKGAELAEMANAAVINADKLFPPGSVTLHQMQALSANNLEDTIVRAASLTECLGSTLAPIFKTIAGTGNITVLPDSDTVKYEDRMGISGWVDNRLLFIGNRTLLETHGIPVPSLELDRKILRQGYFPVYVATQNRACALLVIQYNVDKNIARELRKLTGSGVNLLISSCDPNLTEEMICDYFGLYSDSVKVMSAAGRHLHRNATAAAEKASASAVCGRGYMGIASVLNCAAGVKNSNFYLTVSYILTAILGILIFAYSSFAGSGNLISCGTVLIYSLISTVVSYLLYSIKKP